MPPLLGPDGEDITVPPVPWQTAQALNAFEYRPPVTSRSYDLEMRLLGSDGGDGVRAFLKSIGSDRTHPLLNGWLEKLEAYRTGVAGFDEPRDRPRNVNRRRVLPRLQLHHDTQPHGLASGGGPVRNQSRGAAHRRAGRRGPVAGGYCTGRSGAARRRLRRLATCAKCVTGRSLVRPTHARHQ
jgi:hypothetical protein